MKIFYFRKTKMVGWSGKTKVLPVYTGGHVAFRRSEILSLKFSPRIQGTYWHIISSKNNKNVLPTYAGDIFAYAAILFGKPLFSPRIQGTYALLLKPSESSPRICRGHILICQLMKLFSPRIQGTLDRYQ